MSEFLSSSGSEFQTKLLASIKGVTHTQETCARNLSRIERCGSIPNILITTNKYLSFQNIGLRNHSISIRCKFLVQVSWACV